MYPSEIAEIKASMSEDAPLSVIAPTRSGDGYRLLLERKDGSIKGFRISRMVAQILVAVYDIPSGS